MMYASAAAPGPVIRVQIRSLRGEMMDVEVPRGCTVGQLREFLIGYYGYPPATSLLYGRYVADDTRLVEEFPFGSLVLVTPLDSTGLPPAPVDPYAAQWSQHHQGQLPQRRAPSQNSQRHPRGQQEHPRQHQQHPYNQQQQQHQQQQYPRPHQEHQMQRQNQNKKLQGSRGRQHHKPHHQESPKHDYWQFQNNEERNSSRPFRQDSSNSLSRMRDLEHELHEEKQSNVDPREGMTEVGDLFPRAHHSRTESNSRASNGLRTPRPAFETKPSGQSDEIVAPLPRHSTPPQRSPYRNLPGQQGSPSNSVGNPPLPSVQVQRTDGKGLLDKTPKHISENLPSTPASKTTTTTAVDDNNTEATKVASENGTVETAAAPRLLLKCILPALKKDIPLELPGDATLGDLLLEAVSQEPRLVGSKVVFRGKVLSGSDTKLSVHGIHPGLPPSSIISTNPNDEGVYTVFFASGEYSDVQKTMLLEIETDTSCIESIIKNEELTLQRRRGYYEALMRILFRTDNLQDLEGECRSRRKEAVMRITKLQDMLHVDTES